MTAPWSWLQPALTAVAAALVLAGAVLTIRQRTRADRKVQWWVRTQWALDLVCRDDSFSQLLGVNVLAQQLRSDAADAEDERLIREAAQPSVDLGWASSAGPSGSRSGGTL